jgi:hypothetical protein
MPSLTLVLDAVDQRNQSRPSRPTAYYVQGFTCGTRATVSVHPEKPWLWVLHRSLPEQPFTRVAGAFEDPHTAIQLLEDWLSTFPMELTHREERTC